MLVEDKILPKEINNLYEDLVKGSYQILNEEEKKIIKDSLIIAYNAHEGQLRKSGELYIYHPLGVAKIVAHNIGLDCDSIAAALLHDVVEDTKLTIKDINKAVGKNIGKIVDGLTKISILRKNKDYSVQAENYRRMLLTLHNDIRVILIKIADRLHNMRTVEYLDEIKKEKIASESLYIYAPLAHRVGLFNLKNELEDLSLKTIEPKTYKAIKNKFDKSQENQEKYIESFKKLIIENLDNQKINLPIKTIQ